MKNLSLVLVLFVLGIFLSCVELKPDSKPPISYYELNPEHCVFYNTAITFNASKSSDPIDNFNQLKFAWDFDGSSAHSPDNYSTSAICCYTYSLSYGGIFNPTLWVKNSFGEISSYKRNLYVGGMYSSQATIEILIDTINTNEPIENVLLTIIQPEIIPNFENYVKSQKTDASGKAYFSNLPTGEYLIQTNFGNKLNEIYCKAFKLQNTYYEIKI